MDPEHLVGLWPLVVVEILIGQRQAEDPLRQRRAHRALDTARRSAVNETLRQPVNQPDRCIGLLLQNRAAARSHLSTVKRCHYLGGAQSVRSPSALDYTISGIGTLLWVRRNFRSQGKSPSLKGPIHLQSMRNPG